MAFALSPILRLGPGGDFLSDVFADRLASSSPIAANEGGDFDPGSSSGSPGFGADLGDSDHRRTHDSFAAADATELTSNADAKPVAALDGLELSDLARRAGGLLIAHRLLSLQSSATSTASTIVTSMLATIRRASEPRRTLRHTADRADSRQTDTRPIDTRPPIPPRPILNPTAAKPTFPGVRSSRAPTLFPARLTDL